MHRELVSVVVPSYNHKQYIVQALDSIVAQTYRPLEIVIVDDGSTDGSKAVIQNWIEAQSNIEGISIQSYFRTNHGAHECINFGIKKSKGELISILNSDDSYFPDRIEAMVKPILSGKTLFTISLVKFVDQFGKSLEVTDPRFEWYFTAASTRFQHLGLSMALLQNPIHVSSSNYVFSRKILEKLKGFQNYQWCNDYDFIMRACIYTEPVMVSRHLLSYRMHGTNTISAREQNGERFAHEIRRILEDYFEKVSFCYSQKTDINTYAPSPYNWPTQFKNLYKHKGPFFKTYNFLNQLSLCNDFVFNQSNSEVSEKLNPFLQHPEDDSNCLRSLMPIHFLHQSNFEHRTDPRVKNLKIISVRTVETHSNTKGTLIHAKGEIELPYFERLGLLGVFHRDRLVAVLRYQKSIKKDFVFKGFTSEEFQAVDTKNLKVCWLDFAGLTLICRWQKKPNFIRTRKGHSKPEVLGHLDLAQVDKFFLKVHGWSLFNRELPDTIKLFINKKPVCILPELEARDDLKPLLKNPGSFGVAGFRFYLPVNHLPKGRKFEVSVEASSGKGVIHFKQVVNTGVLGDRQ
jgi:glycosyltransferase involved in cell wall biosynthesis